MPIRKTAFVEDEVYHVCNRGVEKRDIFHAEKDYLRFIHDLYEFNDENPAVNLYYKPSYGFYETWSRKIMRPGLVTLQERKPIVKILSFTLMPNHFHLLLTQIKGRGITNFMHKLGAGYAMYFNQKYERSGVFFQGPFKAVLVEREAHLTHLPFYIHGNPLDLKFPEWRQRKIRNPEAAMGFLEKYRWSSFPDYVGKKNFPSVIDKELFTKMFGSPPEYRARTLELLKEMEFERVRDVALEEI